MGFDLSIILNLSIDPENGLPFVWDLSGPTGKKNYVTSEYTVPEMHRKYLEQRGSHFHQYIKPFADTTSQCSAETFFDLYPSWATVKKGLKDDEDYWQKTDHDGFKDALKWMVSKPAVFGVMWSY